MRSRSFEQGPEPYPDEKEDFPETMPEEPEINSNFDINPEEGLIDEEENKRQEDEVEETYKKKPKDATPVPEKKLEDLEINKKIIEAQSTINKLKSEIAITTDIKRKEALEEFLKDAEEELEKWFNYRQV